MKGKSLADMNRDRGIEDTSILDKAYREAQLELPLAALRKASGITQAEMADRLGKSQAAVSKFEGRGDFLCSTLYRYARSIGADIDLKIRVAGRHFDLVVKDDENDVVFALAERISARQSKPAHAGNVVQFKVFALSDHRRRGSTRNLVWPQLRTSEGGPSMTTDVFLEMADRNNEKKSATA